MFIPTERDTIEVHYVCPSLHSQPSQVRYLVRFYDHSISLAVPPAPVLDEKKPSSSNAPFTPVLPAVVSTADSIATPLSIENVTQKIGDPDSYILLGEYLLSHAVFFCGPPSYSEIEGSASGSNRALQRSTIAQLHLHNPSINTELQAFLPRAACSSSDPNKFYEGLKRTRNSPGFAFNYIKPALYDPDLRIMVPPKTYTCFWEQVNITRPQLLRSGSASTMHAKLVYVDPTVENVRLPLAELFVYNLNVFLFPATVGYFIGADASRRYNELTLNENNIERLRITDKKGFEVQVMISALATATAHERAKAFRNSSSLQKQEFEASQRAARQAELEATAKAAAEAKAVERKQRKIAEREARELAEAERLSQRLQEEEDRKDHRRREEIDRQTAQLLAQIRLEDEEKEKQDREYSLKLAEEENWQLKADEETARALQAEFDAPESASSTDKRKSRLSFFKKKSKSSSSTPTASSAADDAKQKELMKKVDDELARQFAQEDQEARRSLRGAASTNGEFQNRPFTSAEI